MSPIIVSTVATAKLSILSLYRRIFFVTETFRRDSLIIGMVVLGCWIASVLGSLLGCSPVSGGWRVDVQSNCIDFAAFFLGLELVNCILDLAILWLPLRIISGLQMPLKRKLELAIVFTMGSLVFVAGIVRMALIYRANSNTLSFAPNVTTTNVENGTAIICACLPLCGPVLSRSTYSSLESLLKKLRLRFSRGKHCSKTGNDSGEQLHGKKILQNTSQETASDTKLYAGIATVNNAALPDDMSSWTRSFNDSGDIV